MQYNRPYLGPIFNGTESLLLAEVVAQIDAETVVARVIFYSEVWKKIINQMSMETKY